MEYDLVFEGGGAKGMVFVGAYKAFEQRGHTTRRLLGTSAGSITATLIAAGYNSQECLDAVAETLPDGKPRFTSFMDTPTLFEDDNIQHVLGDWLRTELDNPLIPNFIEPVADRLMDGLIRREPFRHMVSLLYYGGWYAGDALLEWIKEKLDAGGRNLGDTTLSEFAQRTGRDLSLVASDVSGQEMLVLNHRTAPNCPTRWAVRMSMSAPFAWQEVLWKPEWGLYRGRDIRGHRVVDGGMLSNFPIGMLVTQDEVIDEVMGTDTETSNVIAFLIDESIEVPDAPPPPGEDASVPGLLDRIDLLGEIIGRIRGYADTMMQAHDKVILDQYKELVCRLPAKTYGTLEFDMSIERMQAILKAGEATMNAFFDSHGMA